MDLLIEGTKNTPEIVFISAKNEWIITGKSILRGSSTFYDPILNWFTTQENTEMPTICFHFKLDIFDSLSSMVFLDILIRLRKIMDKGTTTVLIKWYYDDDIGINMAGERLMKMAKMPFELIVSHKNQD